MTATSEKTNTDSQNTQAAKLQAEVKALREELRRARRLATMGTMTAMVAHEFRNILTPMVNCAQLARRNPELAEKAMNRVANGSQRATSICSALLGLTDDREEPQRVRLADVVSEALAAMARPPERDQIELYLDIPEDLDLTVRRAELEHVLLNLLINARKALLGKPADRRIELAARREGDEVIISVTDNGPGIDQQDLERIFQPFCSNDAAAEADSGYGLGLAVCRELAASLGGEIYASSAPGRQTHFVLRVPDPE